MTGRRTRLTTLWIFVLFNYLYCDLIGLMELPMVMVVVSRLAPDRINRRANLAAGAVMTAVQVATLLSGTPTAYYVFLSVVEIGATALIVRSAWTWHPPQDASRTEAVRAAAAVQR